MSRRIDKDTVTLVAKKALLLMSQHAIPLYPENYLVWFDYVIGVNKDLEEDINRLIQDGKNFSEEINGDLYKRYFGKGTRFKQLEDAEQEIRKILQDALAEILYTQEFTSDYREKLNGFTQELQDATDLNEIRHIVSHLLLATVDVIKAGEQIKERLAETTHKSEELQKELEKAQQEILIDPLTALYNRKAFDRKIMTYIKAFELEKKIFSLVMIDIDFFKQFNDEHGHLLGDQVLKYMGSLLTKELKGKDFVARYGGEEFAILLAGTSAEHTFIVADNIRKSLDGVQLKYVKTGRVLGKITISAGVAAIQPGDTLESLIKRADDALYLAKKCGRNNVKSERDMMPLGGGEPVRVSPSQVEFRKRQDQEK